MDRVKLLQNPQPIDRVARRVVKAAKPEDLWRPMPKHVEHLPAPGSVLRTAPIPWATLKSKPGMAELIGKRRDRVKIVGYAADQKADKDNKDPARWVVRCDCGNQEYRTRIFRWIGTNAPDMCRECRVRDYRLRGSEHWNPETAFRVTVQEHVKQQGGQA